MQRVLVTGAAGFVCGHIVNALLDAGYGVIALDRSFTDQHRTQWENQPVTFIEGDETALSDTPVDFLIHGAAITAGPEERGETPEANFRANMDPALVLSEWAHTHGVQRSVFISSSGVSRNSTSAHVTEAEYYEPTGMYSVAKLAIEGLVRTLHQEFGRDTLAVRLGFLYGPSERRSTTRPRVSMVASLVEDALTTGKISVAATSPSTDWTYVPDIGRSLVALLRAPRLNNTLYHLTSGEALSQIDIADALKRVIPDLTVETHDKRPGFRGVLVGERLQADTGFSDWTPFADGLAETIAWFRHQLEQTR